MISRLFFFIPCLVLPPAVLADDSVKALAGALSFHAGFDGSADATFGKGNRKLHVAPQWGQPRVGKPGLPPGETVLVDKGAGKFGDALRFKRKIEQLVYFPAEGNLDFRAKDWSGTVSLWLRLSPDEDLEPGFCDPIQITSKDWDDASFFVDFSKDEKPRHFRLGAFADKKAWNPTGKDFDKMSREEKPMVFVEKTPFQRDRWTHVVFTWEKFNTGESNGVATLYLDGKKQGSVKGRQTYTWEPGKSLIMLGFSYTGWMDDLAAFNRALSEKEIGLLLQSKEGVKALVAAKGQ